MDRPTPRSYLARHERSGEWKCAADGVQDLLMDVAHSLRGSAVQLLQQRRNRCLLWVGHKVHIGRHGARRGQKPKPLDALASEILTGLVPLSHPGDARVI